MKKKPFKSNTIRRLPQHLPGIEMFNSKEIVQLSISSLELLSFSSTELLRPPLVAQFLKKEFFVLFFRAPCSGVCLTLE